MSNQPQPQAPVADRLTTHQWKKDKGGPHDDDVVRCSRCGVYQGSPAGSGPCAAVPAGDDVASQLHDALWDARAALIKAGVNANYDAIVACSNVLAAGAPAEMPPLVIALPDYETRQLVIASDEIIDGQRVVCAAIKGAPAETPKPSDGCKFCLGAKGGVPGNANVLGGEVICDYCTALLMKVRDSERANPTSSIFAAQPAGATDAKDGERLDLIEKCVAENGYCYIHQNMARYELIGLGLLGDSLREALDALALRRAALAPANSEKPL